MAELPSWMDSVLATPIIGVRFEPWLTFPSDVWPALERVAKRWKESGRIWDAKAENPMAVQVATADGVSLTLDVSNIVATFAYQLKVTEPPGRTAQIADVVIEKYSKLIEDLSADLDALIDDMLPTGTKRTLTQLGVMTTCHLARSRLPPGVDEFVRQFSHAWTEHGLLAANAKILGKISQTDAAVERCHHAFSFDETEKPDSFKLQLDWQRIFVKPQPQMGAQEIKAAVRDARVSAVRYFERFGSGELDFSGSS